MRAPLPLGPAADELRRHLHQLYLRTIQSSAPADHLAGIYFRTEAKAALKARRFVVSALFALLRRRVRTVLLATGGTFAPAALPPAVEASLALYRWLREDLEASAEDSLAVLHAIGAAPEIPLAGQFDAALTAPEQSIALRHSLLPELALRWERHFGPDGAAALAASLQQPAPLQIRIDPQRISRAEFLQRVGDAAHPGRFAPSAVEFIRKVDLREAPGIDRSLYEIQDEGSQLVALALGDLTNRVVLDACAGAGGKTLALASWFPTARLDAWDLQPSRLEPLRKKQSEGTLPANIDLVEAFEDEGGVYDAVLVDAPCRGLGRLRRDPACAWQPWPLEDSLRQVSLVQQECLRQHAAQVAPGGILVYATCSFEPEESTEVSAEFLRMHPHFTADPLPSPFQETGFDATRSSDGSQVTLLPHLHGTDGFFIARFRRVGIGGTGRVTGG
jgi:16S rRNA (cytosine967-C5)-methyltransferase